MRHRWVLPAVALGFAAGYYVADRWGVTFDVHLAVAMDDWKRAMEADPYGR